jgi:hypothetical protein
MKEALKKQGMLHELCVTKQNRFYLLEDKYRVIFSEGVNLLFEKHPELRGKLPNEETKAAQILAISDSLKDEESECKHIAKMMKTIPQLVEAENMNAEIGEACLEYFFVLCSLHSMINEDRKRFFSDAYLAKMDELADDGIMMYFLEMPTFPLLDDKCDANQVLDSFIFGDYMSTKVLLESFFTMAMPGDSMRRKQEDLDSAVCNMMSGYQRTAARNWFSLLESAHKKCAAVLEGFWEKAKVLNKGIERAKKIQELFDKAIDVEWEQRAWKKLDAYYQQMVGKEVEGVVNRNSLVHGDYNSPSMDITDRDVIKIMLMWLNMRLISDHFCYIEEMIENRITLIPYLCTLPEDLAIDIMNLM